MVAADMGVCWCGIVEIVSSDVSWEWLSVVLWSLVFGCCVTTLAGRGGVAKSSDGGASVTRSVGSAACSGPGSAGVWSLGAGSACALDACNAAESCCKTVETLETIFSILVGAS